MARLVRTITDPDDPAVAEFRNIREKDLVGRNGHFIAEGTVVLTMLEAAHARGGPFSCEKLLILENRLAGLSGLIERFPPDVPLFVASEAVLSEIAGFHLHRGVLALGRRGVPRPVDALLAGLPETALVVVACGIANHDNIGGIFRNAVAFGAGAVLLDATCCDPLYRKALRVSVGSVLKVPHATAPVDALLAALGAADFDLLALSPSGAEDIRRLKPARRTALLLGTEGEGLPEALLARLRTVRIPQAPGLDSLNVGVTAGIALFQLSTAMDLI